MLSRRQFLVASSAALAATMFGGCSVRTPLPATRSINFGFEDVVTSKPNWKTHTERLKKANANAVSIAVGRPDWMAFPWEAYPDIQADLVRETERDFVAEALRELRKAYPDGFELTLTVDALLPGWIGEDKDLAGISAGGKHSESFASVSALTDGAVADRLIELAVELRERYEPQRIAFTELMFDGSTFGEDDLDHYKSFAKAKDWPRTSNGKIDESHDSIYRWRSKSLAKLLGTIKDEVGDTKVDIDVRAPWQDPTGDRAESGHDYDTLLDSADRIVVWNYFAMNDVSPKYGGKIAKALQASHPDRYTMSSGLWGEGDDVVSPQDLAASLRAVAQAGAESVSVSPASSMTAEHWDALAELWHPDA